MKCSVLFLYALLITFVGWSAAPLAASDREMDTTLDQLFTSHQAYHVFFDNLRIQVVAKNKTAVAKLVSYPMRIQFQGKNIQIKNQQQFIQHYDTIFTPDLVNALAKQQYKDLFANSQGVMVGNGMLWFSGICHDNQCQKPTVLITAINQ
jgi:hypothetical protein